MARKGLNLNIYNLLRLLISKDKESYLFFYNLIGFAPKNLEIYKIALSHKSYSSNKEEQIKNNERLEFLGDSVIDVVISEYLFKKYPFKQEGFLTKLRSYLVQRESLNVIAVKLGLDKQIKMKVKNNTPHFSVYGNALEALVGAIYIDRGFKACKYFILNKMLSDIDIEKLRKSKINFKSVLLEWGQKNKINIEFKTKEIVEIDNKYSTFDTNIIIDDNVIQGDKGYSKKESQQKSSKKAIAYICKKYHIELIN